MDIVSLLTTGPVAAIFGGITGVLGGWLKNRHDLKMFKMQQDAKKGDQSHELAVMKQEVAGVQLLERIKQEGVALKADYDGLLESIKADTATYSTAWADKVPPKFAAFIGVMLALVDFIRGLVRPLLTLFLTYKLSGVFDIGIKRMTDDPEGKIALMSANAIIYLTMVAVGWWFGTRPPKRPKSVAVQE